MLDKCLKGADRLQFSNSWGEKNVQFWQYFFCNKEKELDSLEPWYLCIWWFIENVNSNVSFPQFVPFRDYIDRTGNHILSMARLAKDVLAEIPDQFLSYMRTRGIKPSPAPPPYTPPGQPLQTQIWGVEMWKIWTWGLKSTCRILSLPYAALHAFAVSDHGGDSRVQEGVCRPGECHISAQEKPMKVCLLPLSSIPLGVWILSLSYISLPGKPGDHVESSNQAEA